ncbi:MAG: hypothetical protein UH080_04180 [Ruminococcus sp.]|jgi:hypothetical protein|nr:hypothetical protein [Ruminococcus sp.]
MSDIQDKINEILSNPEALRQVQSLGEQLGLGKAPVSETKKEEPKPDLSMLSALGSNGMSDDMMKSIAKILPMMSSVKGEDDTTRLLRALRPFLCEEKRVRLDKAEKMLKLIRIIPLLKGTGIF